MRPFYRCEQTMRLPRIGIRTGRTRGSTGYRPGTVSVQADDTNAAALARWHGAVADGYGEIELVEALGVVTVARPLAFPREEAVFALACLDDDPHGAFSREVVFCLVMQLNPLRRSCTMSGQSQSAP